MNPETFILAGGVFCAAFAVFHLAFWKLFRWKEELAKLTSLNRAIVQVLNLSLTWVFVVFAYLSFMYPVDLLGTNVGRAVVFLVAAMWYLRAVEQVFFFGLRHWLSVVFFVVFLIGGTLYAAPLLLV